MKLSIALLYVTALGQASGQQSKCVTYTPPEEDDSPPDWEGLPPDCLLSDTTLSLDSSDASPSNSKGKRLLSSPLSLTGASSARTDEAGHVLHVSSFGQISRTEVVAALELGLHGGDGFEALVTTEVGESVLLVLEKDQTTYDDGTVDNPDGAFIVENAFVKHEPDVKYIVDCPEASDGAMCDVLNSDGTSVGQIQWFDGSCTISEDYPIGSSCFESKFQVSLFALKGPQFLVGASSQDENCPNMMFLWNGKNSRIRFSLEDTESIAAHPMGEASLHAILDAEGQTVEDLHQVPFDINTNNCLHYAGGITRRLGLPEGDELAKFIIENVATSANHHEIAKHLAVEEPHKDDLVVVGGMDRLPRFLGVAVCSLGVAMNVMQDCYHASRAISGSGLTSRDKIEDAVYAQIIM